MPDAIQAEKDKIAYELSITSVTDDDYEDCLKHLGTIQKFEQDQRKLELEEKELRLKERELELKEQGPSWKERAMDILKVGLPSLVTGMFSFALIRHMTKHEQDDGLYYGSKAMSFIKKP